MSPRPRSRTLVPPPAKAARTADPKPDAKALVERDIRAARAFAAQHHHGLSSRIADVLSEHRAALTVLVQEKIPPSKIQEFIHAQYGIKLGIKPLKNFLASL